MRLHYWNIGIDVSCGVHTLMDKEQFIEHHYLLIPELIKTGLPQPGTDPIFAIIDSQLDVVPVPVAGKPLFKKPKLN